jgi:hypothetical protein
VPVTSSPPPARKAPAAPAKPAAEKQLTRDRRETLTGFGQLAQAPLIGFRLFADAGAVGVHWPGIARELANLAETQEQIAAFFDPLIKVGPYTALVTAVLPFFAQIAVNHGRAPAGIMGTVPASMLTAQVESALAQAELEALQAQHQAEQAAEAMREQMAESRRAMQDKLASAKVTVE